MTGGGAAGGGGSSLQAGGHRFWAPHGHGARAQKGRRSADAERRLRRERELHHLRHAAGHQGGEHRHQPPVAPGRQGGELGAVPAGGPLSGAV